MFACLSGRQLGYRVRLAVAVAAMTVLPVSVFGQTGQLLTSATALARSEQGAHQVGASQQLGAQQKGGGPGASVAQQGPGDSQQPTGSVRRLTVDEAVKLALEQNLGIQIQRIEPQIQDVSVAQVRSLWAPQISSTFSNNTQDRPVTDTLSGNVTTLSQDTFRGIAGLNQLLPWGGSYQASWESSRFTTTNQSVVVDPQLTTQLTLQYTQPLLRNFKIDNVRQQVALSQKARDMSETQLHAAIVQTSRNVRNAYWDLVYQIDNYKAVRQSLELAQQSLRDNTRRVEIGTMAPIDIVDAKVEVARNEESVILAQEAIDQAQDNLRMLIFDPSTPDFWSSRIEPAETVPFQAQTLDTDGAVRHALEHRTDLKQAKSTLEQSDISLRYFRNQILPDVNAQAFYLSLGQGGITYGQDANSRLRTSTVVLDRAFSSALSDIFRRTNPTWALALQIAYPLGTSTARANLERAKLQYQQAHIQLKNLEMQIAAQVRGAARQVEANQKRVESARASRGLAEEKLAAEEKKFAAGIRETFFVFQAQRDLSTARVLEVRAIADYNKSLVDFEAVQEISVGGGTSGVVSAGTGALQPGSSAGAIIR